MKKFMMRRLGVADESSGLRPSLQDCIEAVLQQSDTLIDDVLKGLETSLGQNKVKVTSLKQRPIDQPSVERLRSHADAVRATFGVQLRLAIYHSGAQESAGEPLVRFADLQLLEEKQLDANIEFALAQQEILLAVDDVLPPLNALVSSLLGWMTVQAHLNPLRPDPFARALRECLTQHVSDEEARSSLITPAAGFLGVSLRQLYKELIDWLRSQGVEPVVPMSSVHSGDAASRGKAESSVSRTLLTLDKLRRLLSGELDGASNSGIKEFLHTVPASLEALEDMKMVEPMMKRLSQRAKLADGAAGKSQPVAREKTEGRQLGKQLGEEVVRLMLDNLMQDHRLLPAVRAQVKALEPVLLQLAQVDSRFFSDRRHPARQLLDRLTHRSLRYASEGDEGFQSFLQSIVEAIRDLVASQGDANIFTRVLATLEERWSRSEVEQRQRQEGSARALLHAEQRNLLAHRLAADFQERVKNTNIPELVMVFLCGPWAQVVAESQLRCVDGTADTDGYLALVDDLIWSVQSDLTRRNRNRLVQLVPGLLVKLRQGLQLVQYPQERTSAFFDQLITYHEMAFEVPKVLVAPAQSPESAPQEAAAELAAGEPGLDDVSGGDAFWLAENEAAEAGYLTEGSVDSPQQGSGGDLPPRTWSASDLVTGSWVELQLKGEWVRAQLTWASPHRTLFMFVSGKGEAHSMSQRTMERLRSQGSMRIVSDGHVVDNALDAVAQTALRNDRDQSAKRQP